MCTVAFLPGPSRGYVLGHNRDESLTRARGLPPTPLARGSRTVLAPRDPDGGGTWVAVNDAGVSLCLLNAAEADPSRLPPSPRSRGLVLWEALHLESISAVVEFLGSSVRLEDVRAFHLVAAEPGTQARPPRIGRLRWDGVKAVWDPREGPCLFASSSKDQAGVERKRGASWRRFLDGPEPHDREALALWLASHEPSRGDLSVCMHRIEARTVSRTLIEVSPDAIEMHYLDGPPCESSPETRVRVRLR